ncbi:MAG: HPP family protein [Deltaproteobacteria bacterium]|nr:HPP family protein [Deltaproteobacteria bacterium]
MSNAVPSRRRLRLFVPILAGATLRERVIACIGALIGISLTAFTCGLIHTGSGHTALIVAPMGASAVLLFAVPASPMAQPWAILGGNMISALVGMGVAHWIAQPALAAGVAVSLAIIVMSLTRCLHPPGGAAALTAVLGGPIVDASGLLFPLVPVGLNSLILLGVGIVFHRLAGRAYPHLPAPVVANTHHTVDPPPQLRVGFQREDIDAALGALHETFDVDRDDVARLLEQVELQAAVRASGELRCHDIMSRDIITVAASDTLDTARLLLLAHDVFTLPVVAAAGQLVGIVGHRELLSGSGRVGDCMSKAATAPADAAAISLVPMLTDGSSHAVVIVDAARQVQGLITQTDLLVAMMRTLSRR